MLRSVLPLALALAVVPTVSATCHDTSLGCVKIGNGFATTLAGMVVSGALAVETENVNANGTYRAVPGDEGRVVLTFVKGSSSGEPFAVNATLKATPDAATWEGGASQSFTFDPSSSLPMQRTFNFTVNERASPGWVILNATMDAKGETAYGEMSFEVVAPESEASTPAPVAGAALVIVGLTAWALRRR